MSVHRRVTTNRKKKNQSLSEIATVGFSLMAVSVIATFIFLFFYQKKPRALDYMAPSATAPLATIFPSPTSMPPVYKNPFGSPPPANPFATPEVTSLPTPLNQPYQNPFPSPTKK